MKKKLKDLKIRYVNVARIAKQKKESQRKLNEVFSFIFEKVEKQLQK